MIRAPLILAAVLASGLARAATFMFYPDGRLNVEGAQRCANKPYPASSKNDDAFYQIEICRLALLSRHGGWIEANPGKPDPVPPVEMVRPDDFKAADAPPSR